MVLFHLVSYMSMVWSFLLPPVFLSFSVGSQQMRKQGGSFAALQVLSLISEMAQRPTHSLPLFCVSVWGVTSVYTTNSSLAANSAYSN